MKKIVVVFVMALAIFKTYAQVNLNSSLTACYALDGSAAEPINNLTGTLSAVTATVDRNNNSNSAYQFAGSTSSYIKLPNDPLLKANTVSFSAWIKYTGLGFMTFAHNGCANYQEGFGFAVYNYGNGNRMVLVKSNGCGSSNQFILVGNTVLTSQTWYHVGFYAGPDSLKIYVNGLLDGTLANSNSLVYNSFTNVFLGSTNQSNDVPYNGTMDNVRFYNRKLSNAEFNALYTTDPSCTTFPTSSFSISPTAICAGSSATLTDLSSSTPTAWVWNAQGAQTTTSSVQNPVVTFTSSGIYTISLSASNAFGAGVTTTQTFAVLANPVVTISPSNPGVCLGQSFTLTASGASSYFWNSSVTSQQQLIVTPVQNSIYTVTAIGSNSCVSTTTYIPVVYPIPTVSVNGSANLCLGSVGVLTAVSSQSLTYSWSTGASGNFASVQPVSSSVYTLTGTSSQGCVNSSTFAVNVNPLPVLQISGNATVCLGLPTTLLVSGSASTYTWSNSITGNLITITPSASAVYTVIGTDGNGCSNSNTQTVVVNPLPAVAINASTNMVCDGSSLILSGSGASTYTWTNGVVNNVAFYPNQTSGYTVTGIGSNGCRANASIQVTVLPTPTISYVASTTPSNCPGDAITVYVAGGSSYVWSTTDTTSHITVSPYTTTTYTVKGTAPNGCSKTVSITLTVNTCVGLKSLEKESLGKIYPNPSTGKFILEISNEGIKTFSVVNLLGAIVLKSSVEGTKTIVDLSNVPNGIYFLRMNTATNSEVIKLIKE